jgi:cobalt-precorrin 5A hydrolase/precorrin-3B C17-methyltransferase
MTKIAAAVVVLNNNTIPVAQKIISAVAGAQLYGLAGRTFGVDVSFSQFQVTLQELFTSGTPIVGICATGILIRTLAPLLANKQQEPPVVAVAEDGSAVVPLLGGLNGVNNLAQQIAAALGVKAAITTAGDIRFGISLANPPDGYRLSEGSDLKAFISDLLAGSTVRLEGHAPWLSNSSLPLTEDGQRVIQITEKQVISTQERLVYHPATIAIGVSTCGRKNCSHSLPIAGIQQMLVDAQLSPASVAGVFTSTADAANPAMTAIADSLGVPIRFFTAKELQKVMSQNNTADAAVGSALAASCGRLVMHRQFSDISCAIAIAPVPINLHTTGRPRGRLAIVGIGPGKKDWISPEVRDILSQATDVIGYSTYLDFIRPFIGNKKQHKFDNREEITRARTALDLAAQGRLAVLVSSGDPGIYAMAAAVFETLDQERKPEWESIEIYVAPGISAMQAAAAKIGAPLGHDFCAISLSDILKPWSVIEKRIHAAAEADFAIAFYNPVSKQRTWQLQQARNILLQYRRLDTTVVIARHVGREGESVKISTLEQLSPLDADMQTVIIVGSSHTRTVQQDNGNTWVYTPRRYIQQQL